MQAWEISGLATSSAFDVSATDYAGSSESAPVIGPTATTTQANTLVIAFLQGADPGTYGAGACCGSNFLSTPDADFSRHMAGEAKVVASQGAQSLDFTSTNGISHEGLIATYKDANAGGGGSTSTALMLGVGK